MVGRVAFVHVCRLTKSLQRPLPACRFSKFCGIWYKTYLLFQAFPQRVKPLNSTVMCASSPALERLELNAKSHEMKEAVEVRPRDGYRIWLRYADGVEGEVDLSDLAGRGVFRVWADPRVFKKVYIDEGGAIAWEGGVDLCPDALYLRLTGKRPEEIFPRLKTVRTDA